MRIWDVHPGFLSRQRLLGEHAELHAILSILKRGSTGYSRHPETLRWKGHVGALRLRHDLLVSEMALRGLAHHSPAPHRGPRGRWPRKYVDAPGAQLEILARKYGPDEGGRIDLPRGAQELWAAHKYSVLARDQHAYRDIGRRVARMRRGSDIHPLAFELVELLRTAPDPGNVRNALEHMWGHVRRMAGPRPADPSSAAMLERIRREALSTGEPYLVQSTALSDLAPWCRYPG
jgi:hypothetical protein